MEGSAKWVPGGVARSPLDWAQIFMRILTFCDKRRERVMFWFVFLVRSTFFFNVRTATKSGVGFFFTSPGFRWFWCVLHMFKIIMLMLAFSPFCLAAGGCCAMRDHNNAYMEASRWGADTKREDYLRDAGGGYHQDPRIGNI